MPETEVSYIFFVQAGELTTMRVACGGVKSGGSPCGATIEFHVGNADQIAFCLAIIFGVLDDVSRDRQLPCFPEHAFIE